MRRGLDRRDGGVRHRANILQRIAQHIHQNDAGALRRRQPHEGAQAGRGDLAIHDEHGGINHHLRILVGVVRRGPSAAAQEIQRGIVGDPKQPALGTDEDPR
jgi:hypothetical protein